jgi:hypothetical protein
MDQVRLLKASNEEPIRADRIDLGLASDQLDTDTSLMKSGP